MGQHVVLMGLTFDPNNTEHVGDIDKFFKDKGWGKLTYVMQFKTLPGHGGPGGRTDVVFEWSGTSDELGRFSVQRFGFASGDVPRWLEDYITNNEDIIPPSILNKLNPLKCW